MATDAEIFAKYKIPPELQGALSYMAYQRCHSSGEDEVRGCMTEMCDDLSEPLQKLIARLTPKPCDVAADAVKVALHELSTLGIGAEQCDYNEANSKLIEALEAQVAAICAVKMTVNWADDTNKGFPYVEFVDIPDPLLMRIEGNTDVVPLGKVLELLPKGK